MEWLTNADGSLFDTFIEDGETVDVGVAVLAPFFGTPFPPQGGPPLVALWVPIPFLGPPPIVGQPANQLHLDLHYSEYVSFETENSRLVYRKIISNQRAPSGAPQYSFLIAYQSF
jgi:hypothetical protein